MLTLAPLGQIYCDTSVCILFSHQIFENTLQISVSYQIDVYE